jgi:hypothetical protein
VKSAVSTGTSAKTLIQLIAAANHAFAILFVEIGFAGTSNTAAPILFEILRQTTAGTMSALTLVKQDDSVADSFDTTAQHTSTSEPTAGDILFAKYVHPQTSVLIQENELTEVIVGESDRIGFRVTAGADVNAAITVGFEE